jgi:acyl-CoA thioesterase
MTSSWAEASAVRNTGDRTFVGDVPDGWQQGRGAFGGLVIAIMARAAEDAAGAPDRRIRTVTVEIMAPVLVGQVVLAVEALRIGSGTSTVAVRLSQNGELAAHAVFVLGRRREGPSVTGVERPEMPDWRALAPMPRFEFAPTFTQNLEYRPTGVFPFSGSSEGRSSGWVRFRDPGAERDAAFTIGMADAWWPAMFSLLPAPRPTATITFSLDLVATLDGLDPEAPLYHDARTLSIADGYQPELRTLWGADGRLVAVNHQTFVIIK